MVSFPSPPDPPADDIRPGLVFNRTDKRKLDQLKKKIETKTTKKSKTYKEQEQETRDKGLSTAIAPENKGFKLLEKMGYKVGSSLGKTSAGITEPINIKVKESSSGVGKERHDEEVISKLRKMKEKKDETIFKKYQNTKAEKVALVFMKKDYYKAQRICEELDSRQHMEYPFEEFYWTWETMSKMKEITEENEEDGGEKEGEQEKEIEPCEENLKSIIDYLRSTYFYCIYCAITGANDQDLKQHCPGAYRSDHDN